MNRRDFLHRLEAASAAAICAGAVLPLTGCIGFHYVNATVRGSSVSIARREFDATRFALVDVPGMPLPLYVYRDDKDRFTAVSTRCMHRGCQVEPVDGHLVCPCHGSEYSNVGEVLKGPTQRPLRRLPVTVEADRILIELPPDADQW